MSTILGEVQVGLFSAKHRFLDSYFPLLSQLDGMRVERFNKWFNENYLKLFGNFYLEKVEAKNGLTKQKKDITCKIKLNYKNEKTFFIIGGGFILFYSIATIPIQVLFKYPIILATIRFLNTSLVWFIMLPLIRYIITSTLFIKEYSNLDLNPVISTSGNDGFSFMGRIFSQNLVLLLLFWIINWTWNMLAAKDPLYTDFLGLGTAVIIVVFWMVFTPHFINRALKLSKSTAISLYKSHLKLASKRFLKMPDDSSLEKLDWLIQNEKKVLNISTRLFTIRQWILIVFSFVIVIAISTIYVIYRLDIIDSILEFFK